MMPHAETNAAKQGDRVRVQYSGVIKDDSDTKRKLGREVFEFTVGSGEVMPGISSGVVGMIAGERKQMTLQPQDAYGNVRSKLIKQIPRGRFKPELVLSVGKRLAKVAARSGRRRNAVVVGLTPDAVVVDCNHPLAGKILEIELQLVSLDSSVPARPTDENATSLN